MSGMWTLRNLFRRQRPRWGALDRPTEGAPPPCPVTTCAPFCANIPFDSEASEHAESCINHSRCVRKGPVRARRQSRGAGRWEGRYGRECVAGRIARLANLDQGPRGEVAGLDRQICRKLELCVLPNVLNTGSVGPPLIILSLQAHEGNLSRYRRRPQLRQDAQSTQVSLHRRQKVINPPQKA